MGNISFTNSLSYAKVVRGTSDPTSLTPRYPVGTLYVNETSSQAFVLVDNTTNNSVWNAIGFSGAMDWQDSVVSASRIGPPNNPDTNDRYLLLTASPSGDWSTASQYDIVQFDGVNWDIYTPNEGWAITDEETNTVYIFNGTSFVNIGTFVDHGVLIGLADDDHCFSDDTELLTKEGWKIYKDISEDEVAATFNLDTEKIEFQKITGKYVYDSFTEMIHLKSQSIDLLVTPEHRIVYKLHHSDNQWEVDKAEDLMIDNETVTIPRYGNEERIETGREKIFGLLGWIVSEGNLFNPKTQGYGIRLFQNVGNSQLIDELLYELNVPHTHCIKYNKGKTFTDPNYGEYAYNDNLKVWYIRSKWARENLRPYLDGKKLSKMALDSITASEFDSFLSSACDGDGTKYSNIKWAYYSKDKELIDQIQSLCVRFGYSTCSWLAHNIWYVSITRRAYQSVKNIKKVSYKGDVWCVSVPNGTLVIRRNGKVCIAGNTQYPLLLGRSGGQSIIGGIDASANLTFKSTSNATRGIIHFGADDLGENLEIHDAGTLKFWDDSDDTSVTIGPVINGTTILGITGSLDVSGTVDANSAVLDGGTNTFSITNGTASLDVAAGATVNIDQSLTVDGQAVTITGVTQANTITLNESLIVGGGNNGTLTFSAASKTLTVEDNVTVGLTVNSLEGLTIANGALIYGTAADALAILSPGTTNRLLQTNAAAAPTWVKDLVLGSSSEIGTIQLHDAGTLTFYDDGDNTNVVIGPVGDGTTILGLTGTLNATGLQVGGAAVYSVGGTDIPVTDGGTGVSTLALNGILYGNAGSAVGITAIGAEGQILRVGASPFVPAWTTATYPATTVIGELLYSSAANVVSGLGAGADTTILVGGGAAAPVWTTATGTGAPVRAGSPTFTTQITTPSVVISDAGKIVLDVVPDSDHTATGIIASETVGENVVYGELLYLKSDGKWWKSDADASTTMPGMRIALASISADAAGDLLSNGVARDDSWSWTVGGLIYASTTPGALTQVAPSGDGDQVQIIGSARTATTIIFWPSAVTLEIGLDIEAKDTGYAITLAELTAIPKTFTCSSATPQTFTMASVPTAADIGKRFSIVKPGTAAGTVTFTAPAGFTVGDSAAAGSITCPASVAASIELEIATTTKIQILNAQGTWAISGVSRVYGVNPAPLVNAAEATFTETGAGTYTATFAIPINSTVLDVIVRNTAVWDAATSASLVIGDDDDANGYVEATDVLTAPAADTNGAGAGLSSKLSLGATIGVYKGGAGKYCAAAKTITATITSVGAGTAGRTRVLVEYVTPTATAATKV